MTKRGKKKPSPFIYISALDNVIKAMHNHRVFERFGFNLPKVNNPKGSRNTVTEFEELKYKPKDNDWVKNEINEVLTGYSPDFKLKYLLDNFIDLNIE